MALKYAVAALAIGAGVKAQTTDNSNFYSITGDYYGNTRTSSSRTSMFWTATIRYVPYVSEEPYTYTYGEPSTTTYLYTTFATIKPTVTPTVTPTSTYLTSYYYSNVAVIEEYYPTDAVASSDISTYDRFDYSTATVSTRTTYSSTEYYMPVTMTAPASCATVFTVATQAEITDIPSIVAPQLKPTSTEVTVSSGRSYDYEIQTWWLTESAAPFTSTDDYYYSWYIASCTPPPASSTGSSTSGGGSSSGSGSGSNDDSWYDYRMCYFSGCTSVKTWIIIIATVLPGLFLLGFVESWYWYTRLMKGKSAMRCGTVMWILLSLWVLCFTRMQDARSKEDQKVLLQQWKEMPAGKKFKNWSWGFKRRYPVPLLGQFSKQTVGIVPEGQPLHPAMAQAPPGQVFYYGPPPGAPGWQQGPNGGAPGYAMPQGYPQQGYPQQGYPQQGHYAANVPKDGVVVGSQPVGTATQPQAPQPTYQAPTSPPSNGQLPPLPQQAPLSVPHTSPSPPAPSAPVSAPPAHVSEAPAEQTRDVTASETTPAPTTQPQPTHPAPAKPETNDDLYK